MGCFAAMFNECTVYNKRDEKVALILSVISVILRVKGRGLVLLPCKYNDLSETTQPCGAVNIAS